MTSALMPEGRQRYYNNDGTVAAGGKLYTYSAGTLNPKNTFTDAAGTVPHQNPIILDAKGEAVIFWEGAYKVDLKAFDGTQVTGYPVDNVNSDPALVFSLPTSLSAGAGAGLVGFNSALVYGANTVGKFLQNIASAVGATFVGFTQNGVGAILRSVYDKLFELPTAEDFGAVVGSSIDNTSKIQAALTARGRIRVITPGAFRVDGTITLGSGQVLILGPGVSLKRFSASSVSTDPVVWCNGGDAVLKGAGQGSSGVYSQNRAPKGVVSVGHQDMTQSHANVLYCRVSHMTIGGGVDYGQTTGAPDFALYMANPQIGGLASYFHTITDLRVQDANVGIALFGEANANFIERIQGVRLGNVTHPEPNRQGLALNAGATDNNWSSAFLHQSPNSTGLVVDNYDNTATPGGSMHLQQANSYRGMVFEQGGASAVGLRALVATGACHYEIMSNCAGGDVLATGFNDNNWRIGYGDSRTSFLLLAATQKTRFGINTGSLAVMQSRYLRLAGLTENTTYKAVTVTMPGNSQGALVKILFSAGAGSGLDFQGAGEVTYELRRSAAGAVVANAILSRYSGLCRPCVPEISGTDVILKFIVSNNGTLTSVTSLLADVTIVGNPTVVFHETPTTGALGVALAANI